MKRCFGNGISIYEKYHDEEWGIVVTNDHQLFETLILDGAQAGLSWLTILKKRDAYRKQFYNFNINRVARMTNQELEKALTNSTIIRNQLKIYSTRTNARVVLEIQKKYGSFAKYLWAFVNFKPLQPCFKNVNQIPTKSVISEKIAKSLKNYGMAFVGPTIIYAYMQAIGMTNDHPLTCPRHKDLLNNKIFIKNLN